LRHLLRAASERDPYLVYREDGKGPTEGASPAGHRDAPPDDRVLDRAGDAEK
jgi:hypothetical protein